jgi:hypothetical protein
MSTITVNRAVLEQVLEALEKIADWDGAYGPFPERNEEWRAMAVVTARESVTALRAALAQEQEPVAWTDRELELIDGMIEVQLRHAAQCDAIANRPMAERQKGWDMERVAVLRKIKSSPPRRETEQEPVAYNYAKHLAEAIWSKHYKDIAPHWKPLDDLMGVLTQIDNMSAGLAPPRREWQSLSEEERDAAIRWAVDQEKMHFGRAVARAIEAKLKEENNG